jgi:hypothetical protein
MPGCNVPATTVDHVLAVRLGGSNAIENMRAMCHMHNSQLGGELGNRLKQERKIGRRSRRW